LWKAEGKRKQEEVKESMCVCVREKERVSVCVCARKREIVREREMERRRRRGQRVRKKKTNSKIARERSVRALCMHAGILFKHFAPISEGTSVYIILYLFTSLQNTEECLVASLQNCDGIHCNTLDVYAYI